MSTAGCDRDRPPQRRRRGPHVNRNRGDWVVVGDARRGPGMLRVRIDDRSGRVLAVTRVVR